MFAASNSFIKKFITPASSTPSSRAKARDPGGFIFIELLLATSLGLLLLSITLTTYLNYQKNLRLLLALSQLQNNMQKTQQIFQRAFMRTGRLSCFPLSHDTSLINPPYALSAKNMLTTSQTDFTVHYVDYPGSTLVLPIRNQTELSVDHNQHFSSQDILVISDCHHAEIFQVRSVYKNHYAQQIVTVKPLRHHYENHAEVGRLLIEHYFVKQTQRFNKDGTPIYALFMTSRQKTDELVEGVESMRIHLSQLADAIIGVDIQLHLISDHIKKLSHHYFSLRESDVSA